jgi:Head domain of trimeric autotransporter adhesin/Chaperone of endosialidase
MKKSITFLVVLSITSSFAVAQNVGIGTKTPAALLHVKDGTVLFSGLNYFTGNPAKPPVTGKGTRTFWYAEKAAFRTGGVYNENVFGFPDQDTSNFHNWDRDSIGVFSFAAGFNTKAKGDFSFAMGNGAFAEGFSAASIGNYTKAKANFSFAAGNHCLAEGMGASAFGGYSQALGNYSFAAGDNSTSTGLGSVAMGSATAAGKYAAAFGNQTTASGDNAFSSGDHSVASGDFSTAMGNFTVASGDYSTALGKSSKAIGYGAFAAGSSAIASGSNSFAMGVNTNTNNRSNSFCFAGASGDQAAANSLDNQMMMRFDNYTFWVSSSNYAYLVPASNGWAYTSDKNKKENFLELNGESVLQKIAAIPFYSWNFKAKDTRQYRHYGIMAQDFYSAFGKDDYGSIGNDTTVSPLDLLGVAYSGIKALEKRTETLQHENKQLADEVNMLKGMLVEMDKLKLAIEAIKRKIK